jgi:alkylated DNA repair dioxygenase AlkB
MMQSGLFDNAVHREIAITTGALPSGLTYVPDLVSIADERALLDLLDNTLADRWMSDLSRRVQHFGYRYDYKARALSFKDRIESPPPMVASIGQQLVDLGYFAEAPDQVIVNEYQPGQGISPHIDRATCFGPTVASLSLGSDIVLEFISPEGKNGSLVLPARSLVVLSSDARFTWRHGIASRKSDRIAGFEARRQRRVSLTFRTVLLDS